MKSYENYFPLSSLNDILDLLKSFIANGRPPDIAYFSILLGKVEHTLSSSLPENKKNEVQLLLSEIDLKEINSLFQQFRNFLKSQVSSNANIKLKQGASNIKAGNRKNKNSKIKDLADAVWSMLARNYRKDRPHMQTLYSLIKDKRLDSIGVTNAVTIACYLNNFLDVHMVLSEDHSWIQYYSDESSNKLDVSSHSKGNILETMEVTWHGKGTEDRRGESLPIVQKLCCNYVNKSEIKTTMPNVLTRYANGDSLPNHSSKISFSHEDLSPKTNKNISASLHENHMKKENIESNQNNKCRTHCKLNKASWVHNDGYNVVCDEIMLLLSLVVRINTLLYDLNNNNVPQHNHCNNNASSSNSSSFCFYENHSVHLLYIKKELLSYFNELGYMARFPQALVELANVEYLYYKLTSDKITISSVPNIQPVYNGELDCVKGPRSNVDDIKMKCSNLLHQSLSIAQTIFHDRLVFVYIEMGRFHYNVSQLHNKAIKFWADAADVIAGYKYSKDDEEAYKAFYDIANHFIPDILKRAAISKEALVDRKECINGYVEDLAGVSSKNFTVFKEEMVCNQNGVENMDSDNEDEISKFDNNSSDECSLNLLDNPATFSDILRFYDGLCCWEEGSSIPILHVTWSKVMCSNINRFKSTVRGKNTLTLVDCEGNDECNDDSGYVDDSFCSPLKDDECLPSKMKNFNENVEEKNKSFIDPNVQNDSYSTKMAKSHVSNHIATTSTVFKNIKYECMDGGSRKRKISSDSGNNKTENLDRTRFNNCKSETKMEITNDENNKDFLNLLTFTQNKNLHGNDKSSSRVSKKYSTVKHRKLEKCLINTDGKVCSYDDEIDLNKKSPIRPKNPYLEILEKNCSLHLFNPLFILNGEGKIFLNDADNDQCGNLNSKSEVFWKSCQDHDKNASKLRDCVNEVEVVKEDETSLFDNQSNEMKFNDSKVDGNVNSPDYCNNPDNFDKVPSSSDIVPSSDIKTYNDQSHTETKKNIDAFNSKNEDEILSSDSFTTINLKIEKESEKNENLTSILNEQKVSVKGINMDVAKCVTGVNNAHVLNVSMNSNNESSKTGKLLEGTYIVPNLNESGTEISQNNSLKLTLHSSKIKSIKNLLQMNRLNLQAILLQISALPSAHDTGKNISKRKSLKDKEACNNTRNLRSHRPTKPKPMEDFKNSDTTSLDVLKGNYDATEKNKNIIERDLFLEKDNSNTFSSKKEKMTLRERK